MRKAVIGLAIFALVAGVALVAVSLGAEPSAVAQETEDQVFNQTFDDVLDGLVDEGVITGDQRDKIAAAFEERFVRFGRSLRATPHLEIAAGVLGIDVDELAQQLKDGSTIADVAGDKTDEVIAALVADQEARIDEAVADGKITAEKAEEVRIALGERITALVNGEHPGKVGPFGWDHFHGRGGFDGFDFKGQFSLDRIAEALGLTADELHEKLVTGSSLADLAESAGIAVEDFLDTALAGLDEQLDTLVADERLTRERADEIRSRMAEMMESMINGDMPGFGFKFDLGDRFHRHGHGFPGPGGWYGTPDDDVNGSDTSA